MRIEPLRSVVLRDDGRVEPLPLDDTGLPMKPDGYEGREIHATRGSQAGDVLGFVYSRDVLTMDQYGAVEAFLERETKRRGQR